MSELAAVMNLLPAQRRYEYIGIIPVRYVLMQYLRPIFTSRKPSLYVCGFFYIMNAGVQGQEHKKGDRDMLPAPRGIVYPDFLLEVNLPFGAEVGGILVFVFAVSAVCIVEHADFGDDEERAVDRDRRVEVI